MRFGPRALLAFLPELFQETFVTTAYVFRRIVRSPGFSTMAVATIALGIGINLGIFCVTKAVFLNSLGVPDAASLVYYTLGTGPDIQLKFSDQQYEALRSTVGTSVLAWQPRRCVIQTADGQQIRVSGALVTGNTFSVLGLQPFVGHFFDEAGDVSGGGKEGWTAVVSYSYWKTHPSIVGQTITINRVLIHVVGVLPREFAGVDSLRSLDIVLPQHFGEAAGFGVRLLGGGSIVMIDPEWFVLGRLPSGTSIQQVQAGLKTIEPSFEQAATLMEPIGSLLFPNTAPGSLLGVHNAEMGVTLEYRALRAPLLLLELLAGAVLLFCCCNLILLLVSRARREAHATAIRLVLGARLRDQVRLPAVEAAALAGIGCTVAIPIAWGTARGLSLAIQSAPGFSTFLTVSPDISLLLLSVPIALIIACLTSAGASLWVGMRRTSISLKDVVAGRMASRSRSWIVGAEVFASVVLMSGAVISGVGFQTLSHQSGFADGSTVMAEPHILLTYGFEGIDRMVNLIRNFPQVQSVATTNMLPLSGSSSSGTAESQGSGGSVRQLHVSLVTVTLDYFSAIGTRIVRGRDFTPTDLAGEPVCVLSSNAATALFPNAIALGKYLSDPPCRVVGVAEDAHFRSMSEPADSVVYQVSKHVQPSIIVRAINSTLAIQAVREAIKAVIVQAVGPDGDVTMGTIQEHVDKDLRLWRVTTLSGAACAFLAAIILAIGLFGVLSLQVAEREREIGIRLALGANMKHVSLALLKQLGPAVVVGLILGSTGALLTARKLIDLFQLSAGQVLACYLGSLILVGFLMLAAAAVPLGRAFAVSPVESLSAD